MAVTVPLAKLSALPARVKASWAFAEFVVFWDLKMEKLSHPNSKKVQVAKKIHTRLKKVRLLVFASGCLCRASEELGSGRFDIDGSVLKNE